MSYQNERELKVSYLSKEECRCPVCDTAFRREELLTGGGRMIAGPLTDELHRVYEGSVKYGDVYPLAYPPTVCPECWFASDDKDFVALPRESIDRVMDDRSRRIADIELIFPSVDFNSPRDLVSGAAAQYLVMRCYDFYPKEFSPTIKQGIAVIRASWLLEDMDKKYPGQHYDWIAKLFKMKAQFFYNEALFREQSGKETLSGLKNFGPDIDKNYSYEGMLYLTGLLQMKYGPRNDGDKRTELLREAKRTIAKIFGLGRSSKAKPGPLLEKARELYDSLNKELNEIDE